MRHSTSEMTRSETSSEPINNLWIHTGFLYVDNYLFLLSHSVALIMACELCIASQILNIPISWRKSEFGPRIQWIGWQFEVTSGYIALPLAKLDKLRSYIAQMLRSSRTSKKALEKTGGAFELGNTSFLADAMLATCTV